MDNLQKNLLTKRFQTTMIGALYEFEETFGYLWGQNNEDKPLTPQQEKFRLMWEDTRNQILNNGNNQLRKCIADLDKTMRSHANYNYHFKYKGKDQ